MEKQRRVTGGRCDGGVGVMVKGMMVRCRGLWMMMRCRGLWMMVMMVGEGEVFTSSSCGVCW
jgi:hypothetical protein